MGRRQEAPKNPVFAGVISDDSTMFKERVLLSTLHSPRNFSLYLHGPSIGTAMYALL